MASVSYVELKYSTLRLLQTNNEADDLLESELSMAPTSAPTTEEFVTSTDSEIIAKTLRVYGSLYLFLFLLFCCLRKWFPKLYNLRSWVPEMRCDLAITQNYGFFSWFWQVFFVTDDELLNNCGMDALCFLRCLRMGTKLCFVGIFNSCWLIPLYMTAEVSDETAYLTDRFVVMSIANLPNNSKRFAGPVVAAYIIILYSMRLIVKEYDWFIEYRHKHLSKRAPRNYSVYVSGIPADYRSSYALANYFRQCSWNASVQEAHIAMDFPSLAAKVARRKKVLEKLEHVIALEQKKGVTLTHRTFKLHHGVDGLKKVDSVDVFRSELSNLNNEIASDIGEMRRSEEIGDVSEAHQISTINITRQTLSGSKNHSTPTILTSAHSTSTIGSLDPIFEAEEAATTNTRVGLPTSEDLETINETPEVVGGGIERQDSTTHPFLSMFGLDAAIFSPKSQESFGWLESSISDSPTAPSTAVQSEDDGEIVRNAVLSDNNADLQENYTNHVGRDADQMNANCSEDGNSPGEDCEGDVEEGRSQQIQTAMRSSSRSGSWTVGSAVRANAESVTQSVKKVGTLGVQGVKRVGSGTKIVGTVVRANADAVASNMKKAGGLGVQSVRTAGTYGVTSVKKAAEVGIMKIQQAPDFGASLAATAAASAAAMVPIRMAKGDGIPREAGFVVFNDLYTTHAARQMLQHPSATKMQIEPAPNPEEIFWRNVGLPAKARRSGTLLSVAATTCLCFFWSIPSAFLSSLTEVNSLKENLPFLEKWIETAPAIESLLALVAPLFLLLLNESVLPLALRAFATWEGLVASSALEASLFVKLCSFVIIQTFFVSAVSGTITAELSNILDDPENIIELLANSLPAQSSYFIQICFVFTFFLQGFDLVRAYPLTMAFFRRYAFGPRLTAKERRKTWNIFYSLEDPPEFWHAEIFAQVILFFVVFFVYSTIAPITSAFLCACFLICESGYRYHFIHNYKTTPDSGGKLWQGFIQVLVVSMLIGELTLVGLLILKNTLYAVPALAPLIAITILFMIFVIPKRRHVASHLPTMLCVELDKENSKQENANSHFAAREYLQPELRAEPVHPEKEFP